MAMRSYLAWVALKSVSISRPTTRAPSPTSLQYTKCSQAPSNSPSTYTGARRILLKYQSDQGETSTPNQGAQVPALVRQLDPTHN